MPRRRPAKGDELAPLKAIRTETVLSRLPVHNLAKRGNINVQIKKVDANGEATLVWEVSHNERFGQPRQIAYKLDTLVINRRIDEEGRPLPKRICLGSLREICKELGLADSGKNRNAIKLALQQNATSFINAKLKYKATDGSGRRLEALFSRYSVVFSGETLPDGKVADAVYLILNEPYWEVLNNAPVRPLDYNYLRELGPAAQRFYEIISYRIFAAVKNGNPYARITYSEYCTYSAQKRYYDYDQFKKQMWKIHQPHIKSKYIVKVQYEEAIDEEGNRDWMMIYAPGSKAEAEFAAFGRRGNTIESASLADALPAPARPSASERRADRALDPEIRALVEEIVACGVSPSAARTHAERLDAAQRERALHIVDYFNAVSRKRNWDNPPGVLMSLLRLEVEEGVTIPKTVQSRRAKTTAQVDQQELFRAVERESVAILEEQRKIDTAIDEALSEKSEAQRRALRARAEEISAAKPGFRDWAPAAQRREVERQVRKLVLADLPIRGFAS